VVLSMCFVIEGPFGLRVMQNGIDDNVVAPNTLLMDSKPLVFVGGAVVPG
jgi:hypothetical protein